LTVAQILDWADHHFQEQRRWPNRESGPVLDDRNQTWKAIDLALRRSGRGLNTLFSLAHLLDRERGVRNKHDLAPLAEDLIVDWARVHHARTGAWPNENSGVVNGAPGEVWHNVDHALRMGLRSCPGGDSLARLLARRLDIRNRTNVPKLTVEQILDWADDHRTRTGDWPRPHSGPVLDAPGEDWQRIDLALKRGHRGFVPGGSLNRLLSERRGALQPHKRPLTTARILAWADAHHRRTGFWPNMLSGPVVDAPGEDWGRISQSLYQGHRGLPGGLTLARLLLEQRGARRLSRRPSLTVEQILAWADKHHRDTKRWPNQQSGPVAGVEGERWHTIDESLRCGQRGLPGGSSLACLLAERRGVRHRRRLPRLSIRVILQWADGHFARTGRWPSNQSGAVHGVPGETWGAIGAALSVGLRGLPGKDTLAQFLNRHRRAKRPI
jgi:hypothetical protein